MIKHEHIHEVFTHDTYRVVVGQQEYTPHPWEAFSQICQLVCWHDDADFSCVDPMIKHDVEIVTPEQAVEYCELLKKKGKPFVFIGLHADKYGFLGIDGEGIGYSGALILTEDVFRKHIDASLVSDEEMYECMKQMALDEFETLKAYWGSDVYEYEVQVDLTHMKVYEPDLYGELKPFESGIDTLFASQNYFCVKGDFRKMYERMVNEMPDEVPAEIKAVMTA